MIAIVDVKIARIGPHIDLRSYENGRNEGVRDTPVRE